MAIKKVMPRSITIDLAKGEQRKPEFLAINPAGTVPFVLIDGVPLGESVAIIEWLDETIPDPPLLPRDPMQRALCRELVEIVNAGTQPLQNRLVQDNLPTDDAGKAAWNKFWIERGLRTFEAKLPSHGGRFCLGDTLTMADLYLVPQCRNAERYGVSLAATPRIERIYRTCLELPEVIATKKG
jgi:maleylacetoacetate isomerase